MSRQTRNSPTLAALPLAVFLSVTSSIAPGAVRLADARTSVAAPDSAPASEVTSGQRVTGHTRTHKSRAAKTSPEQPAPATAQKVAPSKRLPDEPNQIKDQIAPVPDAPVKPGTPVVSGQDTPTPH